MYGKDETDLDILEFFLISYQQENETKKMQIKKKTKLLLGTISLFSTILSFCVYHPLVASLNLHFGSYIDVLCTNRLMGQIAQGINQETGNRAL